MINSNFDNVVDEERYNIMLIMVEAQLKSERDLIANLSNISAIINNALDNVNWVGFYILKGDELILGPFQGMPACCRIKVGEGVCGTAVTERKVQRIEDVHQFDGHIACDSASNSELVIPIIKNGIVYGVLDIDSPIFNRFNENDQESLSKAVEIMNSYIDWNNYNR